MSDELTKALRRIAKVSYGATIEEARSVSKTQREAADLIEQQAARLAELEQQVTMMRDGDTCGRACEGTAYRIEARQAKRRIAALESAEKENGELLTALAECRDAFPVPAAGGELEGHWVSAMANPEEVPAYVKACIESASKDAIRREALETDADRYRWLREQHWNEADVFVIAGSKSQVHLGTDCPRLDRLDAAIDAALSQKVGDQQ